MVHEPMRLSQWERGIKIESRAKPELFAFFWFYEWHLFDAVRPGEHTPGRWDWSWRVDDDGRAAILEGEWLSVQMTATAIGAQLSLEITNDSAHDWPALAAIIPCFNPGNPQTPDTRNPLFLDQDHSHTYFLGAAGLESIAGQFPREIHFDHQCHQGLEARHRERSDGAFVFAEKWPVSDRHAHQGLMVREADQGRYSMGIAWDSFLSAQGHNPWNCMHLSIRVGPLSRGEKKRIGGRIYLLEGCKEDCLQAFVEYGTR